MLILPLTLLSNISTASMAILPLSSAFKTIIFIENWSNSVLMSSQVCLNLSQCRLQIAAVFILLSSYSGGWIFSTFVSISLQVSDSRSANQAGVHRAEDNILVTQKENILKSWYLQGEDSSQKMCYVFSHITLLHLNWCLWAVSSYRVSCTSEADMELAAEWSWLEHDETSRQRH